MSPLNEFWLWFGAALAAQRGSPIDLWRARNGIDEAIATVSEFTESEFLDGVMLYIRPYSEFRRDVSLAAIELYRDLTFGRAAEWEAAFDSEQIGGNRC